MAPNENDQIPMALESLPEYLKSLREKGSMGDNVCVDMGRIELPNKQSEKWKWIQRIVLTSATCMIVLTVGILTYDVMTTQQLTIVVDLNKDANPTQDIPDIVTESGGKILAVKRQEGSSAYEVKLSTRKSRKLFLEWLHKNKNVKDAK